jgi:FlaA1/EpsC-like NDP-sugar epimerase
MSADRRDQLQMFFRRGLLIVYDLIALYLTAVITLLLRFDLHIDSQFVLYHHVFVYYLPLFWVVQIAVFTACRLYSSLWRFASGTEMINVVVASVITLGAQYAVVSIIPPVEYRLPRSYYIVGMLVLFVLVFTSRFAYRFIRSIISNRVESQTKTNVMVVGAGSSGSVLIREIVYSKHLNKRVVCVIDDSREKVGNYIKGIKIAGTRKDIPRMVKKYKVEEIIVAMPSARADAVKEILDICKTTGCKLLKVPGMYQLVNGEVSVSKLKDVDVNDLLGREPINVDINSIMDYVSGQVVMVTGGGGSIGSELCRQIAQHNPKQLVLVDIYENTTYDIQNELRKAHPELDLVVLIASVRNTKRMDQIFETYRPSIVYHAAAHKHVPLMEDSPNEAVKNNVLGTWKVVQAADKWNVRRFVMISTDKAVNPTNIMGASKRLCEMIIQTYDKHSKTEFVAVRFGNVLGSNGSVIPLFKKQIEEGGPVTVTHPDIIRYFMTIPEAVSLVLQAGAYAKGGEIFVLDMGEPVKILDLAKNLILLSGHKPDEDIKIEFTGLRPGEKLYEEMLMKEEGMQETENRLIHIGKPIDMDEEAFMEQLKELSDYVVNEPADIREYVQKLVPTYTFKKVQ